METAKDWFLSQYDSGVYGGPEILRMECQETEKVNHWEGGHLLLLEHGAWIEGRQGRVPVRIMALLMPNDPRVRFWYSALASFKGLLATFEEQEYIELKTTLEPHGDSSHRVGGRPDSHCRLFVWLRDAFMEALKVPDHPDYLHAISVSPTTAGPRDIILTFQFSDDQLRPRHPRL